MPFEFTRLALPDVILIKSKIFEDERGFFLESYKYSDFTTIGISDHFEQDNHSRSSKGIVRGLHFQKDPEAQGKLVSCVNGEIFDVAVDIRRGSPTYGRWVSEILSAENKHLLYVPEGFAHGFCVLSDIADVIYKCTREYSPENDRGILWNDTTINIPWPVSDPILSKKDKQYPSLDKADNNYVY
jgi:dTDP-4-dehydrorhamnose 3,5-epimerase